MRRSFPLPSSVGPFWPARCPRAAFAGEGGEFQHGVGPFALPVGQGPPRPAARGHCLVLSLAIEGSALKKSCSGL